MDKGKKKLLGKESYIVLGKKKKRLARHLIVLDVTISQIEKTSKGECTQMDILAVSEE